MSPTPCPRAPSMSSRMLISGAVGWSAWNPSTSPSTAIRSLPSRPAPDGRSPACPPRATRVWRTATRTASPSAASTWKMAMCSTACASPCATRRALPCPVWTACSSATLRRRWARTARSMCRCSPRRATIRSNTPSSAACCSSPSRKRPACACSRARPSWALTRASSTTQSRTPSNLRTSTARRCSIGGRASTARRPPCSPPSPKRAPTPSSSRPSAN